MQAPADPRTSLEVLEAWLLEAQVECVTQKSWGKDSEGAPWLHFDVGCHLPEASPDLLEALTPALAVQAIEASESTDLRYAAAAALAAVGRFSELPPAERVRFRPGARLAGE